MALERIMIDQDQEAAFAFLKKSIYQKIAHSQKDRLQSHLDTSTAPNPALQGGVKSAAQYQP